MEQTVPVLVPARRLTLRTVTKWTDRAHVTQDGTALVVTLTLMSVRTAQSVTLTLSAAIPTGHTPVCVMLGIHPLGHPA